MTDRAATPKSEDSKSSKSKRFSDFAELVTKALKLHSSGESKQALGLAREAENLIVHLDPPQSLEGAQAFNFLGMIFFESGYARSALPAYERSLAITEQLQPPDENMLASVHNNLGQAYQYLGRLPEAQAALETALSLRRRISQDELVLGFALDNLASVLCQRGALDAAEPMHQEALDIFERKGGPFDTHVATALGNLSNIYRRRKDYLRAEAFRLRALDAHERLSGLAGGETLLDLTNLADLYRDRGDDSDADALMNRLLSIGGNQPNHTHRNLARMLFELAKGAFGDFRLDLAQRLGARAVALLDAVEGASAPDTLEAVYLLANVQRALGNKEAAEQAYQRARAGFDTLQMRDEALRVLIDLGKLYRDMAAYDAAEKLFNEVIENLLKRPERDRQGIASAHGNLGLVYFEVGRYEDADNVFTLALAEACEDGPEFVEYPWLLHNRAMLKYHLGDYEAAYQFYAEAKRLWTKQEGEDHPFVAITAANLALVHWAKSDMASALASFAEAERLRDHAMMRILAIGSEYQRAAYARDLQDELYKVVTFCLSLHPLTNEVARFTAQMLLRRKGRVLDAIAHTFLQLHESLNPEDQILINRLHTVRQSISKLISPMLLTHKPDEERERLKNLCSEEKDLEEKLSYRGALYRPGLEPVVLEDIQHCLPPDGVLIELFRFPEFDPMRTGKKGPWKEMRYAAVVISANNEPRWFDLGPSAIIDEYCDQWCTLLRNPFSQFEEDNRFGLVGGKEPNRQFGVSSSPEARNQKASELYQLLFAPLSDAISNAHHLLIAPDGKLVLMPFGELRDADGRILTDRLLVSYLTSGRDLQRIITAEEKAHGVVVIAAPDFDIETEATDKQLTASNRFADSGSFEPLPGTLREAEEIGLLLDTDRLLLGPAATVDALRNIRSPIVLHVATHGIFSPLKDEAVNFSLDVLPFDDGAMLVQRMAKASLTNPMFCSGLAFSGANHRGAGIITAQEIAGLDFRGTELVVLSACETGLGTVKQGEEFTGLRRALSIAGARTQVTSLWKVDDKATQVLMGHYYRLLLAGHDRAEALQLAQSLVAKDPEHPEWRHPAYWAAFVSSGAWGPISEQLTTHVKVVVNPARHFTDAPSIGAAYN